MARQSRLVIDRKAVRGVRSALAGGLFDLGVVVMEAAHDEAPDAPPYGAGLVDAGGVVGYDGRDRIGTASTGGGAIETPPGVVESDRAVTVVGFGHPARYVHNGTIDTRADPFLWRAASRVLPGAEAIVANGTRRRLPKS